MGIQANVALDKEKHPERYCPTRRCLWRTGGGLCSRHKSLGRLVELSTDPNGLDWEALGRINEEGWGGAAERPALND